jgi:hypothetical protein
MSKRISASKWLRAAALVSAGTALFCATAQASATFPPRKPGLWQTTMVMHMKMLMNGQTINDNSDTPIINELCSNAATDAQSMKMLTGGSSHCGPMDIEKTGGVYTITGSCPDPLGGKGGVITFNGTITPQGDTAYHMVSQSTGTGMSSSMVADSKWLGACPAGMVPGDFGTVTNGKFVKRGNLLNPPATPPAG